MIKSCSLSFCFTIFLASCATIGKQIDFSRIDQLKPGVSTIQDAVAVLGPYSSQSYGNGIRSYGWSYAHANGLSGHVESQAAFLVFDANGKLIRTSSSQNHAEAR